MTGPVGGLVFGGKVGHFAGRIVGQAPPSATFARCHPIKSRAHLTRSRFCLDELGFTGSSVKAEELDARPARATASGLTRLRTKPPNCCSVVSARRSGSDDRKSSQATRPRGRASAGGHSSATAQRSIPTPPVAVAAVAAGRGLGLRLGLELRLRLGPGSTGGVGSWDRREWAASIDWCLEFGAGGRRPRLLPFRVRRPGAGGWRTQHSSGGGPGTGGTDPGPRFQRVPSYVRCSDS